MYQNRVKVKKRAKEYIKVGNIYWIVLAIKTLNVIIYYNNNLLTA